MSRAWLFGDNIDTDALAPGLYMKSPLEELAQHCLEVIIPGFASAVQAGDVLVAGKRFGMGSSREQAAQVLKFLGIQAVLAQSFGGIFYRNAFNVGLPVLVCDAVNQIAQGDQLQIDVRSGKIEHLSKDVILYCEPVPEHLLAIIDAGGLVEYLARRLA